MRGFISFKISFYFAIDVQWKEGRKKKLFCDNISLTKPWQAHDGF
jgi:hypothetical protein